MTPWFDRYPWTAFILIGLAVVIMIVLLVTNRGDLTSAILILVAFTCFVLGLFIFAFQPEDRIDQKLAAIMTVPYTNTLSRILAELGVVGAAHFIVVPDDGTFPSPIMQFNPVSGNLPENIKRDLTFFTNEESPGVITVPSGMPVLEMMEKDRGLTLPSSEPELLKAIREVNQDLLELSPNAMVSRSRDEIIVKLQNFRLIDGCKIARDESPLNCITAPCPICSLAGIMIAKGLGTTSVMQQVLLDQETATVEVHIGVKEWEEPEEHPLSYWGGSERIADLIGNLRKL